MNRQQLLSRLGRRGWQVVYTTGALSVWDRKSDAWRNAPLFGRQQEMDGVRVDFPGRFPPLWPSHPRYNTWAIARYCHALRRRASSRKRKDSIAYLFLPRYLPCALALECRYLVYHVVDDYSKMPGWGASSERLENEIIERADLLIGTTALALDRLPSGGSALRCVLPNGGDAKAFSVGPNLPCPEDLAAIPRPRIGYCGHLNRKVDFNLVAAVASARPDWHWVMIGPVTGSDGHPSSDPTVAHGYADCQRLPNVHFLGIRPVSALPSYVGQTDVNVICYRHDDGGWWNACYPLKVHEYLACGKPVVSSPIPAVMQFGRVIDIAVTEAEWFRALEAAITSGGTGTPDERRAIAFENTWDMRVDQLDAWLTEMIESKRGRSVHGHDF